MNLVSSTALAVATTFLIACGGGTESTSGTSSKSHSKADPSEVLEAFMDCKETTTDKFGCKEFTAKGICSTYGIGDFVSSKEGEDYIPIDEIPGALLNNGNWETLGDADDQDVLDKAQQLANDGRAVVAVSTESGHGNIAWILEGKQSNSRSWGLNCPNAASFFMKGHNGSFVGKSLAYAWGSPDGIMLYARKS